MAIKTLLFIDTNVWLDFYRGENDTSLKLLKQTEKIKTRLIVTYQLESEFKANRQRAILDGHQKLKSDFNVCAPGLFSDASAAAQLRKNSAEIKKQAKRLQKRLIKALSKPAINDPVYQTCQRLFHRESDPLVLTRENPLRRAIRSRALRRFLHNCPPRKKGDLTIGDAINWEWMIECAKTQKAHLIIVTRDSDYGVRFGEESYINDNLRHEFSDRVSQTRKLLLYSRLTDALRQLKVEISKKVEDAEKRLLLLPPVPESGSGEGGPADASSKGMGISSAVPVETEQPA